MKSLHFRNKRKYFRNKYFILYNQMKEEGINCVQKEIDFNSNKCSVYC